MQMKSKNRPHHKRCQARWSPGHLTWCAATFAAGCAGSLPAWRQSDAEAGRRVGVKWDDGNIATEAPDPSCCVSQTERCVTP